MIIEFCGVPGGGKSTLARAYVERYGHDTTLVTIDMYKKLPELWWAGYFALRHPAAFIWLLAFVVRYHARGLFLFSLHLALRAAAKYQKASVRAGIAIIDEGLVHILCTLPVAAISPQDMSTWMRRFILPNKACVALSGTFHRFHGERGVVHPRAAQGEPALAAWEAAVRANTKTADESLEALAVPAWSMPEQDASQGVLESLHSFIAHV